MPYHHEQYWMCGKTVWITQGNNVLLSILFSLNAQVNLFILNQTRIVGYVLCSRAHDLWVSPGPHGTFDTIWRLSNVGSHTTWLSVLLSSPTGSKVAFGCIIISVTFDIISVKRETEPTTVCSPFHAVSCWDSCCFCSISLHSKYQKTDYTLKSQIKLCTTTHVSFTLFVETVCLHVW